MKMVGFPNDRREKVEEGVDRREKQSVKKGQMNLEESGQEKETSLVPRAQTWKPHARRTGNGKAVVLLRVSLVSERRSPGR